MKSLNNNLGYLYQAAFAEKNSGGGFIQEGSDNVDLNTETIDGKTTFHSMARTIFQVISNQPPI